VKQHKKASVLELSEIPFCHTPVSENVAVLSV